MTQTHRYIWHAGYVNVIVTVYIWLAIFTQNTETRLHVTHTFVPSVLSSGLALSIHNRFWLGAGTLAIDNCKAGRTNALAVDELK